MVWSLINIKKPQMCVSFSLQKRGMTDVYEKATVGITARFCRITQQEMIFPQMFWGLHPLWMQISLQMLVRFVLPSSQQLPVWPPSIHLTGSGWRSPFSNPKGAEMQGGEGVNSCTSAALFTDACPPSPATVLRVCYQHAAKRKKAELMIWIENFNTLTAMLLKGLRQQFLPI